MKNLVLMIKLNRSSQRLANALSHANESHRTGEERFYYTTDNDTEIINDLQASLSHEDWANCKIVFIEYVSTPSIIVTRLYIGDTLRLEHENTSYQIFYKITHVVDSPLVIDNFMSFSNLDIEQDFDENSHISIEDSLPLRKQISYATTIPCNSTPNVHVYRQLASEVNLSPFAQRNEYCKRLYNIQAESHARGEFQRDYDRIVHCKAFRRMSDKAQIFTSSKGDHYRTRMTHTLCVAQIARSIAIKLNMNVALTEAIALGHDLGHTPFGHQGERTLNEKAAPYGVIGFKHNYQSLKVATRLEEEYIEHSGLDLSIQTLEGMWKHTKIRKKPGMPLICDIDDFIPSDITDEIRTMLHVDTDCCSTIEGQIVFIADEIAQRSHDLEDALSAGLLNVDSLLDMLSLKKLHDLKENIEGIRRSMLTAENNCREFVSAHEMLYSRISSNVIQYFINDVVQYFETFLHQTGDVQEVTQFFQTSHCVDRQLIKFTKEGKCLNDYLETIVTKQVINSAEVAAFDDKASRVTAKLFDLYFDNPRLLHDGTLQRIYIEMRRLTTNVIHFQDGDIGLVNKEWSRIKEPDKAPCLGDLRKTFLNHNLSAFDGVQEFLDSLGNGVEATIVENYIAQCRTEYHLKQKILILAICDFISGMTDTYALNAYRELIC